MMSCTDPKDPSPKSGSDSSSSRDDSESAHSGDDVSSQSPKSTKKSPTRHWHFPRIVAFWRRDGPMKLVIVNLPEAFMDLVIPSLKTSQDISTDPFAFHAIFMSVINDDYFWRIRGLSDTINDMTSTVSIPFKASLQFHAIYEPL